MGCLLVNDSAYSSYQSADHIILVCAKSCFPPTNNVEIQDAKFCMDRNGNVLG